MQGKKTSPQDVYNVMASWAITGNAKETANELGMNARTVQMIVRENQGKPEFRTMIETQKERFSKDAERIIGKALKRLEGALDDENKDIPVNQLSTVIGTLYDKKQLADGAPTENIGVIDDKRLAKIVALAGYERKQ